jgi:hypothetical protein
LTARNSTLSGGTSAGVSTTTGGLWVTQGAVAKLRNVTLTGGSAMTTMGAYNESGELTVERSNASGGSGTLSYGIAAYSPTYRTTVRNSTVSGGSGSNESYGVGTSSAVGVDLINNVINAGTGGNKSIGVDASGGFATLVNNNINGGASPLTTWATRWTSNTAATLVNNIVTMGGGSSSARGAFLQSTALLVLRNNDFVGASCLIERSGVCLDDATELNACPSDICTSSAGNINAPPLLSADHLTATSPCLGTGIDPAPWYPAAFSDLDAQVRPQGAWDIGVDEAP